MKSGMNVRRRFKGLLALFGIGVALAQAPLAKADVPANRQALDARVWEVRGALRDAGTANQSDTLLAQWVNWPNWGNWAKWNDWNNWPNWGNWANWFNR